MKKKTLRSKLGLLTYWALLPWCLSAQAQDPFLGIWEGHFMEQFKTLILIDIQDAGYRGKILMYSGDNRIQDDELTRISLANGNISFYIPAKETSFEGKFNENNTGFSGNFIFPDKSMHPLRASKFVQDSLSLETDAPGLIKQIRESFPAEELKSDFKELIDKLKAYHPRLYSYTPEDSFDRQSEDILTSLNTNLGMEEFFFRIAPLVASVQCSHTGIRLPVEYKRGLREQGLFFPMNLYFADGKAYCLSAPAIRGLEQAEGSEIRSINGRAMDQIIEKLLTLIPSEGNGMTRKYQELNRDFHSLYRLMDPSARFSVEFISGNSAGTIELEATPYSLVQPMESADPPARPYSFQVQGNPDKGVLKVSSFGIRDMNAYLLFLDSSFRCLKNTNVHNLILDLRDNQGGHPIFAAQLLSYLTGSEFTYFERNPEVKDFEPLYLPMQANPRSFTGRLYVLVNGNCLSTTGHLISLLKFHTEAQFIGEEPGSTYLCNDFSIQIRLDHTGIEANIPRQTFITKVPGFNTGDTFALDYPVQVPVEDILANRDTYASLVCELIEKHEKDQLVRF